jgi:DNA invertase Pin-like site-specific DNA recombinase
MPTGARRPEDCAALYLRRSKKSAANDYRNRSIAEQEGEGRAWADCEGLSVVKVFTEEEGTGASRHSRKARPEWDKALAELREGSEFRTLIVLEVSRADRRGAAQIAALLDEHRATGRRLYIVDDGLDSASENDRRRIIDKAEAAREESERLSKRIQRTKRYRRADGYWLGGTTPYGLVSVVPPGETSRVALAVDPEFWPTARRIAEMALAGMTSHKICVQLNAEGVAPPRNATAWRNSSVLQMLKTPSWAGIQLASSRREDSEGGGWRNSYEAMIDDNGEHVLLRAVGPDGRNAAPGSARVITPEERARILAMLAQRSMDTGFMRKTSADGRARRGKRPSTTLLAGADGLMRCASCRGRSVCLGTPSRRAYRCVDRETCIGHTIGVDVADTWVTAQFMATLKLSPDDSPLVRLVAARLGARLNPTAGTERAEAVEVIRHATAEVERIEDLLIDGRIGDAVAGRRRAAAMATIAAAEQRLAAIPDNIPSAADLRQHLETWDTLDLDDQRALLAMAIDRVLSTKVGQGKKIGPAERLTIEWSEAAISPAVDSLREITTRTA